MDPKKLKPTGVQASTPPIRIPMPNGQGGTELVGASVMDVRLDTLNGTRRGEMAAPDAANLQSQPTQASKR